MAKLTEAERDRMKHALGVGRGGNRNHYAAGGNDVALWDGLVEKGFAYRRKRNPIFPEPIYSVTDEGRAALAKESGQ